MSSRSYPSTISSRSNVNLFYLHNIRCFNEKQNYHFYPVTVYSRENFAPKINRWRRFCSKSFFLLNWLSIVFLFLLCRKIQRLCSSEYNRKHHVYEAVLCNRRQCAMSDNVHDRFSKSVSENDWLRMYQKYLAYFTSSFGDEEGTTFQRLGSPVSKIQGTTSVDPYT